MLWFVRVRSDMERTAVRLPKFDCLIGKSIIASAVEHPNMRFAFCSAALLAGGLLLASITAASAEKSRGRAKASGARRAEAAGPGGGREKARGPEVGRATGRGTHQARDRAVPRGRGQALALRRLSRMRVDRAQDHEPVVARRRRHGAPLHRPLRPLRLLGRASEADVSLRDSSGTDRSKSRGPARRPRP